MPSESEEVWRYSPINELRLDEFQPVSAAGVSVAAATAAGQVFADAVASVLGPLSGRVLVVNGQPEAFVRPSPDASFSFGGCVDVAGAASLVGSVQEGAMPSSC